MSPSTVPANPGPENPGIERLERPSRAVFERDYVTRGQPVILTGITDDWPARRWTPEQLVAAGGESAVRVPFAESGDFFSWFKEGGQSAPRILFRELLERITGDHEDRRFYMQEQPLGDISPALLDDVDMSAYTETREPALFLGRETFMPCHYHGHTEALLCQLRADKEVTLFSPDQFGKLYAHPWYSRRYQFSRVDPRNPDLEQFPRFSGAQPLTFTLAEGEVLYIPVHWWHTTACPHFNFNVTFFWPSKLKRFHFPSPGLQYQAHWLLHSVAMRPLQFAKGALGKS
ncbi:MAG: cupin-like domain-containing protein [Planctomycetota bacterium]